jgi:hypothetical protein
MHPLKQNIFPDGTSFPDGIEDLTHLKNDYIRNLFDLDRNDIINKFKDVIVITYKKTKLVKKYKELDIQNKMIEQQYGRMTFDSNADIDLSVIKLKKDSNILIEDPCQDIKYLLTLEDQLEDDEELDSYFCEEERNDF